LKHYGKKSDVKYAGRAPSASSATGYHKVHETELKGFLKDIYTY
jgi:2-oxoglutarate dehydrogenase complex dehydrogenase (E1) component-like enzyme